MVPGCVACRGEFGGEAGKVAVLRGVRDCSPEQGSAAVMRRRGRTRRPSKRGTNKHVREVRQDAVKVNEEKERGKASWVRREATLTATVSGGQQGLVGAA